MMIISHSYTLFFFNDTETTEIYTLSLHDALPISLLGRLRGAADRPPAHGAAAAAGQGRRVGVRARRRPRLQAAELDDPRSEEHTSELQSRQYLVCRLLLEKKTKFNSRTYIVFRLR